MAGICCSGQRPFICPGAISKDVLNSSKLEGIDTSDVAAELQLVLAYGELWLEIVVTGDGRSTPGCVC